MGVQRYLLEECDATASGVQRYPTPACGPGASLLSSEHNLMVVEVVDVWLIRLSGMGYEIAPGPLAPHVQRIDFICQRSTCFICK